MDRQQLLASLHLFQGLSTDDLAGLARSMEERVFRAGEMILRQGDVSDSMYIVGVGQVNIFLPGEASRRISLKDIGPGECFGELSLFDDQPRSASALATSDVVLLELTRETLSRHLDGRPRAAMDLLRIMAGRLRATNALLSERAARNAVEELEQSLSWKDRLADRVASLNGSWSFIVFLGVLTVAWAIFNSTRSLARPFDPYPFVFYNLVLAILVALQGPLIMMSQNRQSMKDRATAENDFRVNLKNEINIETMLRELSELRGEVDVRLKAIEGRAG